MIGNATEYVFGIDLSSFRIDVVWADVNEPPGAFTAWQGSLGKRGDAFDRSRLVRGVLEPDDGSTTVPWLYMVAGGIEEPVGQGRISTAAGYRVQGAIMASIPPRLTLQAFVPSSWKARCGAGGRAEKHEVAAHLKSIGYHLTDEHDDNVSDALGIMHALKIQYLQSL